MEKTNKGKGTRDPGKRTIPKLLAPAGEMDSFLAAVENGADEIYLGGPDFNARMKAANFDLQEMKEAIRLARPLGIRVHVAMNTLMDDHQLREALNRALDYYEIGVDALIVQDLGLAWMLKKMVPDFPLHLSTQGTVTNLSGVQMAAKLGFQRVVLARECNMDEIREMAQVKVCEIEVFVHGAMCLCYSGQCHLSRLRGGRSANRGMCAQPCRLPYTNEEGVKGYHLSPKDLCGVEMIGPLAETGVSSLKIEGRLKSPEYVATVVRVYRNVLDRYRDTGATRVPLEEREALLQAFNRGGFSKGHLMNSQEDFLSGALAKNQGVFIGHVIQRAEKSGLVDVETPVPLQLGDGIEIHGRDLSSNVLTYLEPIRNGILRIGDYKGSVLPGDKVFRTTSKALKQQAQDSIRRGRGKDRRKVTVDMEFHASVGMEPSLTLRCADQQVTVGGETVCPKVVFRKTEEEMIRRQLAKTGGTPFVVGEVTAMVDPDAMIPLAVVNDLRRRGLGQLVDQFAKGRPPISRGIFLPATLDVFISKPEEPVDKILPTIIRGQIEMDESTKKVEANNLGEILEMQARDVQVFAGPGLNVLNGASAMALSEVGVPVRRPSMETFVDDVPLMITAFPLKPGILADANGQKLEIREIHQGIREICSPEPTIHMAPKKTQEKGKYLLTRE